MIKAELVDALAPAFGDNRAEALRALNAVTAAIIEGTAAEGKVSIAGFGVFETIHRPARMVRNPKTGERVPAEATTLPRFRPGSGFKDAVAAR